MVLFDKKIKEKMPVFKSDEEKDYFLSKLIFSLHGEINSFSCGLQGKQKLELTKVNDLELSYQNVYSTLRDNYIPYLIMYLMPYYSSSAVSACRSDFTNEELSESLELFFKDNVVLVKEILSVVREGGNKANCDCLVEKAIHKAFPELTDFDTFHFYYDEIDSEEEGLSEIRVEDKHFYINLTACYYIDLIWF